ncbi:unnamed protein product [marine sediment metagenome]|uniref:Uncharacterized protein n=1 Tax=marine sediment metagenome TaxID=412755 RepID=X0TMC5_9ZZZZ
MDKNSKPPLQFTKLSTDDIHKHRRDYQLLLINNNRLTIGEKGVQMMYIDKRFYNTFK